MSAFGGINAVQGVHCPFIQGTQDTCTTCIIFDSSCLITLVWDLFECRLCKLSKVMLVAWSSCVNLHLQPEFAYHRHDHASSCTTDVCLGTAGEALVDATMSRSFSQDRCLPLLTMTLNAELAATPCTACICRLTLGSCLNCQWTCHTLKQSIMCGSVPKYLHQQHRASPQSWVCLHDSSHGYAQCEHHRVKQ